MKLTLKILVLLLLPVAVLAQDTTVVKNQANVVAKAVLAGNFAAVIDHMYPKVVQMSGGRAKLLQMLSKGIAQMKAQGVTFTQVEVGTPGKFYKAGTEIHCLVPEYITMSMGGNRIHTNSNLLAISKDGGKRWSFLDLNRNTVANLPKIFPNWNKDLKIPASTQPTIQ